MRSRRGAALQKLCSSIHTHTFHYIEKKEILLNNSMMYIQRIGISVVLACREQIWRLKHYSINLRGCLAASGGTDIIEEKV